MKIFKQAVSGLGLLVAGALSGTSVLMAHAETPETCGGYEVLPMADERLLTPEDLDGLSTVELNLARNEMFARHGYQFQSYQNYHWFLKCDWYEESDGEIELSGLEEQNLAMIQAAEAENKLPAPPAEGYTARFFITKGALYPYRIGSHYLIYQDGQMRLEFNAPIDESTGQPEEEQIIQFHDFGGGGVAIPICCDRYMSPAEVSEFPKSMEYGNVYSAFRYPFLLSPVVRGGLATIKRESGELEDKPVTRYEIISTEDEYDTMFGSVWMTGDGIIMKAELAGRYAPEGQDEFWDFAINYHLEEVKYRPIAPDMLQFPKGYEGQGFNAPG